MSNKKNYPNMKLYSKLITFCKNMLLSLFCVSVRGDNKVMRDWPLYVWSLILEIWYLKKENESFIKMDLGMYGKRIWTFNEEDLRLSKFWYWILILWVVWFDYKIVDLLSFWIWWFVVESEAVLGWIEIVFKIFLELFERYLWSLIEKYFIAVNIYLKFFFKLQQFRAEKIDNRFIYQQKHPSNHIRKPLHT